MPGREGRTRLRSRERRGYAQGHGRDRPAQLPRRPQPAASDLNRLAPVGDGVRRLQRKLWAAAKQSPERRFHALYDRICRRDVLEAAWKRVRVDKGAAGVDKQTLADVEDYGVERLLGEIAADLRQAATGRRPAGG